MPVNSFENYPMSWRPDKARLTAPIYQCLADMLEQDIKSGHLPADTKLPPQRELADFLDLNLSTVTKAYKLCEMRGLIQAIVGRGTYVAPYANAPTTIVERDNWQRIEMASIHPFYQHNKLIRDLALEILKKPFSERLFESSFPFGAQDQIETASRWLGQGGVCTDPAHTLIAPGGQSALSVILCSLFEAGDRIAVDSYTYSNFIGLANLLHLQLVAVEGDAQGMRADLLECACENQKIKGIYLMPSGNNPTNIPLSESRRRDIAAIIRKKDLTVMEDDNYAALLEQRYPPLSSDLPDNCIYINGMSKPVCPGLRIAYMHVPSRYRQAVERGMLHQHLKLSALNIKIASELIQSGLAERILSEKRALSVKRNRLYHTYFPEEDVCLEGYCQWLKLPAGCTGRSCEAALLEQGVRVFGAERFAVQSHMPCNAIRIATCSPENEEELCQGLQALRNHIGSYPPSVV